MTLYFKEISIHTRKLEKSGFTKEQAEAVANANAEASRDMAATQALVSQRDLAETKADLEKFFSGTRAGLQQQIAETKHELLKWLIGMMTAQTALLAAFIAYLR